MILAKYLLFQIPGWLAGAVILVALVEFDVLPRWGAGLLFLGLLAKDLVLYRYFRIAYTPATLHGTAALVGKEGTAEETLDPEGYVRVSSERWRARLIQGAAPVARGSKVRIRSVEELTLRVEGAE